MSKKGGSQSVPQPKPNAPAAVVSPPVDKKMSKPSPTSAALSRLPPPQLRVDKVSKKDGSQPVPAPKSNLPSVVPPTVDKKMSKPPPSSAAPPPRLSPPPQPAQQLPSGPARFPPPGPSPSRFPQSPMMRGMRPMVMPMRPLSPGVGPGRFPFSPLRSPMYPQYGAAGSARPTPRPMCKYNRPSLLIVGPPFIGRAIGTMYRLSVCFVCNACIVAKRYVVGVGDSIVGYKLREMMSFL